MKAYIVAHIDVTNPSQYEQYKILSTLAMKAHDVKLLVRGGEETVLEGKGMKRTVIMEFPSVKAAQNFYNSPQYRRARNAREGAAIVDMSIIQGI
ncbi:hypothetical protein V757_07595 [Pelistega indica]|uniref:DUF1330 domain-containing protein n=1 Tax=Pelistega indica TaxID=1414851 RepID=V8G4I5_9BURK|nr:MULTISPECIES: DUF1330 domain-containing protein [Pelistega]ETD70582.1 hypothetical protein V757_07595 [Pelistega indica]